MATKKLHDGTEVSIDTPTRNTSKGRVLLTKKDISEREKEEKATQKEKDRHQALKNRVKAYELKGWLTPFDVIDDAAKRGWDAVKNDRNKIKADFPIPEA
jgi:hypothetical protein